MHARLQKVIPSLDNRKPHDDYWGMRKRSSKDVNTMAAKVITEVLKKTEPPPQEKKRKNPAAVALGRLGGLRGGVARAEVLTSEERSDIARRAAQARWQKAQE